MRHSWLTKFGVLCLNQLVAFVYVSRTAVVRNRNPGSFRIMGKRAIYTNSAQWLSYFLRSRKSQPGFLSGHFLTIILHKRFPSGKSLHYISILFNSRLVLYCSKMCYQHTCAGCFNNIPRPPDQKNNNHKTGNCGLWAIPGYPSGFPY